MMIMLRRVVLGEARGGDAVPPAGERDDPPPSPIEVENGLVCDSCDEFILGLLLSR